MENEPRMLVCHDCEIAVEERGPDLFQCPFCGKYLTVINVKRRRLFH